MRQTVTFRGNTFHLTIFLTVYLNFTFQLMSSIAFRFKIYSHIGYRHKCSDSFEHFAHPSGTGGVGVIVLYCVHQTFTIISTCTLDFTKSKPALAVCTGALLKTDIYLCLSRRFLLHVFKLLLRIPYFFAQTLQQTLGRSDDHRFVIPRRQVDALVPSQPDF